MCYYFSVLETIKEVTCKSGEASLKIPVQKYKNL